MVYCDEVLGLERRFNETSFFSEAKYRGRSAIIISAIIIMPIPTLSDENQAPVPSHSPFMHGKTRPKIPNGRILTEDELYRIKVFLVVAVVEKIIPM